MEDWDNWWLTDQFEVTEPVPTWEVIVVGRTELATGQIIGDPSGTEATISISSNKLYWLDIVDIKRSPYDIEVKPFVTDIYGQISELTNADWNILPAKGKGNRTYTVNIPENTTGTVTFQISPSLKALPFQVLIGVIEAIEEHPAAGSTLSLLTEALSRSSYLMLKFETAYHAFEQGDYWTAVSCSISFVQEFNSFIKGVDLNDPIISSILGEDIVLTNYVDEVKSLPLISILWKVSLSVAQIIQTLWDGFVEGHLLGYGMWTSVIIKHNGTEIPEVVAPYVTPTTIDMGQYISNSEISIVNPSESPISFTATRNTDWLSITPASDTILPTNQVTLDVQLDRNQMNTGLNSGIVSIYFESQDLYHLVEIFAFKQDLPILIVSSEEMFFPSGITTNSLQITNGGVGTLEWAITPDVNWLAAQPTAEHGNHEVNISVDLNLLQPGFHTGTLFVSSNGGSETIYVSVHNDDHPNAYPDGTPITVGSTTNGNIEVQSDHDLFKFSGEGGVAYRARAVTGTISATFVRVYNSAGQDVASDSEGDASWTAASSQTFYIEVWGLGSGTYQLHLTELVSIAVTPATPSIALGQTQQFTAIGTYADASTADITADVTWTSANPGVATIQTAGEANPGLATSHAVGTTIITASLDGITSPGVTLTVTEAELVSIAVTPEAPSIALGLTQQFTAIGSYTDASTANITSTVTWASSNPAVATISAAGLATSHAVGTTTITASLGGITSPGVTLTVTVLTFFDDFDDGDDEGWGHEFGNWIVIDGEYTASGESGVPMSSLLGYSLTNFTFEGDLRITQQGAAHIGLRVQDMNSTGNTNINNGILLVIFPGGNSVYWHIIKDGIGDAQDIKPLGIAVSEDQPLHIKVDVIGDSYNVYVNGVWKNELVDSTYSSGQFVLGINLNYPTPTTWDNIRITATVTPPELVSIAVTPVAPSITLGLTQQFTATGSYTDASTANITSTVTWASSNPAVATISAAGLATSHAVGTTTIIASLDGITSPGVTLTVTGGPVLDTIVSISPANQERLPGDTFTIEVRVEPAVAITEVQFSLTFDPLLVTVDSVEEGDLLNQNGANTYFTPGTIDNDLGTITGVAGAITTPGETVSSSGVFATITFTASAAQGTSHLDLSNVIVGDIEGNAVPVRVNSGSVTIVGAPPQPGDANGDGNINALDITKVERIIAGLDAATPGADANQDGNINALDITKVERIIAGLD